MEKVDSSFRKDSKSYKTIECLAILIFAILLVGCEPETIIRIIYVPKVCNEKPAHYYLPGEMPYGRVAGLKNCLPFLAGSSGFLGEESAPITGLEITTYTKDSLNSYKLKELLGIGTLNQELGEWPISLDSIPHLSFQKYSILDESGTIESTYEIDTNYQFNRFTITAINEIDRRIQGWFECKYILVNDYSNGFNPDTILFSECYFDVIAPH
jgi:hypothetical protein